MVNPHRQRDIESILEDDVSVRYGDEAWRHQVDAITEIADVVGTTYGPYGHDKLVVDNGGNVAVTSETVSILRKLLIKDPVVRMVRDVANSQLFTAGDGTTATVVLMGELVDRADVLVEQGLHPTTIANGYKQAVEIATERLTTLAEQYDITDTEVCLRVAETVMAGTNLEAAPTALAPLVVEAVSRVTDGFDVDLNALRVRSDRGQGVEASEFLSGAVIDAVPDQSPTQVPTEIDSARILLVTQSISPAAATSDLTFSVDSPAGLDAIEQQSSRSAEAIRAHLRELDVDVVIAEGASDSVQRALSQAGIALLTAVSGTDTRFLRRSLSLESVADPLEATKSNIETADVRFVHDETYTTVTTPDAGTATLRLYSTSDERLEELETVVDKAIEAVTNVATDGRVLPGGGAPEAAMAAAVRGRTPAVPGREQLALHAFADAIETLPRRLAQNAGVDGMDCVLALRTAHAEGQDMSGIDVATGDTAAMQELGVLETFVVKEQMLSNVEQAVRALIRIDGLIEEPEADPQSPTGPTV